MRKRGLSRREFVATTGAASATLIGAHALFGRAALAGPKAAAFLASEGDYITGQELNVNGGYHM